MGKKIVEILKNMLVRIEKNIKILVGICLCILIVFAIVSIRKTNLQNNLENIKESISVLNNMHYYGSAARANTIVKLNNFFDSGYKYEVYLSAPALINNLSDDHIVEWVVASRYPGSNTHYTPTGKYTSCNEEANNLLLKLSTYGDYRDNVIILLINSLDTKNITKRKSIGSILLKISNVLNNQGKDIEIEENIYEKDFWINWQKIDNRLKSSNRN